MEGLLDTAKLMDSQVFLRSSPVIFTVKENSIAVNIEVILDNMQYKGHPNSVVLETKNSPKLQVGCMNMTTRDVSLFRVHS